MENLFDTLGWFILLFGFSSVALIAVALHIHARRRRDALKAAMDAALDALEKHLREELIETLRRQNRDREQVRARGFVMPTENDLEVLGLDRMPSSAEELNRAYKARMRVVHPDRGGSTEQAAQTNAARDRLMARFA